MEDIIFFENSKIFVKISENRLRNFYRTRTEYVVAWRPRNFDSKWTQSLVTTRRKDAMKRLTLLTKNASKLTFVNESSNQYTEHKLFKI